MSFRQVRPSLVCLARPLRKSVFLALPRLERSNWPAKAPNITVVANVDLSLLLTDYGCPADCDADIDRDGDTDFFDGLPVDCAAPDDLSTQIGADDDPNVIAGQGTVGLEIAEDSERLGIEPDHVLVEARGVRDPRVLAALRAVPRTTPPRRSIS